MDNVNDSPEWDGQPDPRERGAGAGNGRKWKYALLVLILGIFCAVKYGELQRQIRTQAQQRKILIETLEREARRNAQEREAIIQGLERVNSWYRWATVALKGLKYQLIERQHIYCSYFQPKEQRLEMEKNMLFKVAKDPISTELDLYSDLEDIFKRDMYCAHLLNKDKTNNGNLMWVYLKNWQRQICTQKHKRASAFGVENSQIKCD